MRIGCRRFIAAVIGVAWVSGIAWGAARLWHFDSQPGAAAEAPQSRATPAGEKDKPHLPRLIVLVHPHCPCSRATLDELAQLMTDCPGKVSATVLLVRPADAPAGWERTELARSASAIPGVTVSVDENGRLAQQFHAATSGQALLYDADGRLLFAGGITESRGHRGDNAGRSAITAILNDPAVARAATGRSPVYGCPLFKPSISSGEKAGEACQK